MESKIKDLLYMIIIMLFVVVIIGYPVMMLWNYCLVPALTIAKPVGFLQSVGLVTLFSLMYVKYAKNETNKK